MTEKSNHVQLKWYQRFTYSVVSNTETFYYHLGRTIAAKPLKTIAICWFFVFLSAFGFLRFYQEKNPLKLWVPQNSEFFRDSELLMKTFQRAYRIQAVIIEADNILKPEYLKTILEIDDRVRGSVTSTGISWQDVCFSIPEVDNSLMTLFSGSKKKKKQNDTQEDFDPSIHFNQETYCKLVEMMDKECYEKNILGIWNYSPRKINKLSQQDVIDKINQFKQDPVLGNLKNYEDLLGGVTKNASGHIIAAKSVIVMWMAHLNFTAVDMSEIGNYAGTAEWGSAEVLEWEDNFLELMKEIQSEYRDDLKIYYAAARSFGDISGKTLFQGIDVLSAGVLIMIVYVQYVVSKLNRVEARIYLGGMGLLSVGMAFVVACGLCSLGGVFYGPVHTSLPFLLMGLGVDDMFVIVSCWDQLAHTNKHLPLPERVGMMLKHAGVSITVTTATDVLAFIVGSTTVLPCLQSYCIYAAAGVLLTFVFVVTFFVACFTIDQKRIESNRCGFFPWKSIENYKPNSFSQAQTSNRVFRFIYSKIILTWPGKLLVFLMTGIFLGFSIQGIMKLEQKFDPLWFIPSHSYLGEFVDKKVEYYPTGGFEAYTYTGAINYTQEFTKLREMGDDISNCTDIVSDIILWTDPFRDYVKTYYGKDLYEEMASDEEFNTYLSKFLFSPKGARYQAQFQFEKDIVCGKPVPKIMMSSLNYRFKFFHGPHEHIPAMRRMMNIAKGSNFTTGDRFSTAWSRVFGTWITDEIIEVELIRNLELALLAVMICTSLLIANVQICFWVFVCVVLSMANTCGFMQHWGLTIDIVTCIGLQLGVGLCVDYATHVGHKFLTISEGTLNERVVNTMGGMGSAVFFGGLSTLLGVSFLGFSDAYNFQTFFKIFTLVITFGLFHGLLLLPVILSCIGPKPYYKHKPVQQNEDEL